MNYPVMSFTLCIAMSVLMAAPAIAQTSDGQTPAEETVCDPLKADGVSKGLYGLCVAFCEAQDHASVDMPITADELAALEDSAPSGRILANYNKKKQASDPAMPCIREEEACPCWSAAELASIGDGFPSICYEGVNPTTGLIDQQNVADELDNNFHFAVAVDWHRVFGTFPIVLEVCRYYDDTTIPLINRRLSGTAGTLTHEQAGLCLEQVNTRCAELGH